MSKLKQLTDLMEEDNASGASPRRSSRIATRRLSSCDEIPSSPAKTRSRRTSLTSENNSTPAKITRSKRSSLTLESNSTKDNDSNSSSPSSKNTSSPDPTSGGPAKRTRRRGSLTNSTQDESEASTPIPSRVLPRRLSSRRSMSKSPTRESDGSPILENINLSKVSTPKRRGRKPSVTERVIPLEAIEETELNKVEDDSNSRNNIVDLTDSVTENIPKGENLETILESSILDSQEGADIEKNLSKKLGNTSKGSLSDAGINKSFNKKDKSIEILNDSSLNKSSKGKTLNRSSQNASARNNESIKDKSVEIFHNDKDIQSPAMTNVSSRKSKNDLEKNNSSSFNKSKLNTSNIERAESDLLDVLNLSGTSKLQKSTDNAQLSIDRDLSPLVIIEDVGEMVLSVIKNESVNKSNESDKENHNKNPSTVINEKSEINKESSDIFSEPMEIDDYPPDTSDENIAKSITPNKSLNTQKEEIMLSPIISSVGKRNNQRSNLLNPNLSVFYDVACANSTPKKIVLNKQENGQNNVDSNTSSKKLKDVNISTEEDNVKDKSKKHSREFNNSADLSESKRITRKSASFNKSAEKSEESLNFSVNSNKSKTKLNEKSNKSSKDFNESDANERSVRKLRSSTGNTSKASIDENAKEDLINLDESVNKSTSKQNSKRKSDIIDSDQSDEQVKRQSNRKSGSNENSPWKSKNLSQSIDKHESASQEESKRKSKNLSQSFDSDKSMEKSASEEKTKKKFKDLLTDKEENVEKPTSPRRSKCLSNLIDVDESDDQDEKSIQTSKSINESISRSLMKAKIAASNKSIDALNPDIELEAKINKFVESYNLIDDDDDEHHALLDDQASEGEEDTPSENSCDIPVDGESLGSSDSEKALDESYEHDSFIVSDEEAELLSGNEFDLDQPKAHSRRLQKINDDEGDDDEVKNNSKAEESEKAVEKDVDVQNTSMKLDSIVDPPSEKKRVVQKPVEEDSDLENMSTKPYCGLDPPSVASSRESLSEADKIEVVGKKTESLINLSNISSIKSPRKSVNTSFTGSLNFSVLEDKDNTTRRSRTTSLLVQEQFENYNVENVCNHITKVVNMVYSDSKKENVSLNVSLEFTEKQKSKTPDTTNSSQDLKLITKNLSCDVISVESSDEGKSNKKSSKQVIHMNSSTDSDMSDDIDEDVTTKYYQSRLISKEEDILRQSTGVVKQAKPDPKFSSSSEECETEEQEDDSLLKEFDITKEQDTISTQDENILDVTDKVTIQQSKKRKRNEEKSGKIKILQSTTLIPETRVIKPPTLKEPIDVVPSKKMKVDEKNTIRKKKQKLQPSKNLSDGDDLEISYFPSKILNTIVDNEKSNKKPKLIPSKSSNQDDWVRKAASSPVKPSGSIFTQRKKKVEAKINERDFKSKMLNDQSRNKRMNMETLLKMKSKLKQRAHP